MNKRVYLFSYALLFTVCCFSQQTKSTGEPGRTIDSLLNVLKAAREDTNQVNALTDLTDLYINTGSYINAKQYASEAIALAEKINFKSGAANAHNSLGVILETAGDYAEALKITPPHCK